MGSVSDIKQNNAKNNSIRYEKQSASSFLFLIVILLLAEAFAVSTAIPIIFSESVAIISEYLMLAVIMPSFQNTTRFLHISSFRALSRVADTQYVVKTILDVHTWLNSSHFFTNNDARWGTRF